MALLICRLAGATAFYFVFEDTGVEVWSWAYLVTSAVGCIVALVDVRSSLGRAKYRLNPRTYGWREGFYFAIGLSAQSMTNDLDKTLLARLDTLGATAIYAAAYRVVGVALLPTLALLTTFSAGSSTLVACQVYEVLGHLPFGFSRFQRGWVRAARFGLYLGAQFFHCYLAWAIRIQWKPSPPRACSTPQEHSVLRRGCVEWSGYAADSYVHPDRRGRHEPLPGDFARSIIIVDEAQRLPLLRRSFSLLAQCGRRYSRLLDEAEVADMACRWHEIAGMSVCRYSLSSDADTY